MKHYSGRIDAGVRQIRYRDPVMRELIRNCPPLTSLKLERNQFQSLTNSILSQQISINAARSVRTRLLEHLGVTGITPEGVANLNVEELRAVGVSRPKAHYLLELAHKVLAAQLKLDRMSRLSNEAVIEKLTGVKGIGVWTAQMFLIFSLGRLDVLPCNDFGVRSAIRRLYALGELPNKKKCLEVAEPWRPYATIGSWYCWRSHELVTSGTPGRHQR